MCVAICNVQFDHNSQTSAFSLLHQTLLHQLTIALTSENFWQAHQISRFGHRQSAPAARGAPTSRHQSGFSCGRTHGVGAGMTDSRVLPQRSISFEIQCVSLLVWPCDTTYIVILHNTHTHTHTHTHQTCARTLYLPNYTTPQQLHDGLEEAFANAALGGFHEQNLAA
jgi:hypothetical protein